MKLGTRIFFCYILIFSFCFYYPVNWVYNNLRFRYLEGVEDPLVDQANIMAGIVGHEMAEGRFDPVRLYAAFEGIYNRNPAAQIYNIMKTDVDVRVYITDAKGMVLFDSEDKTHIGKDYSNWRDVKLTLKGEYGARTSRKYETDSTSSVLYVGAPIRVNQTLAGVLTVGKPTVYINTLLREAKPKMYKIFLIALSISVGLSFIVSRWLTLPIKRLTRYATDIGLGKRSAFPRLYGGEIGEMGRAFERMQEALEGKKYAENYVHALTHEIKSPISAIRGAAELLGEDMPIEQRERFLTNIRNEAGHIRDIVDRMLELSSLENQKILRKTDRIAFQSLVKTVLESKQVFLEQKQLTLANHTSEDIQVKGDLFLLHQAVANLIQNAIDFSPTGSHIELGSQITGKYLLFSVMDQGNGIPDFAGDKIFDKFYSLPRPDSGKKSTGLGLNLVREVATLHQGHVEIGNNETGGVSARLWLPV